MSVLPTVIIAVYISIGKRFIKENAPLPFVELGFVLIVVFFLAGLIVSITGVVASRKPCLKGRLFAITGLIFSSFTAVVLIIAGLLTYILVAGAKAIENAPTYSGDVKQYDGYEVRGHSEKSEATVMKWYWDGDPDNNVIMIPEYTPDGQKITGIGNVFFFPDYFRIVMEDSSRDYFESTDYKESIEGDSFRFPTENNLADFGIKQGTIVRFDEIVFTVVIPADVLRVEVVTSKFGFGVINDDGSITFYRCYYHFECDEDNPKYFSDDNGVLYYKSGKSEAIEGCPYKV